MNNIEYFKNFNLLSEIHLAGSFSYNAVSILNTTQDIYYDEHIFMFLYNAAVSVERMQKCVLFIYADLTEDNIDEYAANLKSHSHQKLQNQIVKTTKLKLSADQNLLLSLLQNFYANGRYSNFSFIKTYNYKKEFENFVVKCFGKDMLKKHFITEETYVSENAKEYIGRTLGKLLLSYHKLIREKAYELNIYTYELRYGSAAERVFLNQFSKSSLQAMNKNERAVITELIIYLANSYFIDTGVLNLIHRIKPLELDNALINNYLGDMLNKQIPNGLDDEVSALYEEMSKEELTSRKELVSIIGDSNYYFD